MKQSGAQVGESQAMDASENGSHRPKAGSPCGPFGRRRARILASGLCALALSIASCSDSPRAPLSPDSSATAHASETELRAPDKGPELGAEVVLTDPDEINQAALRRLNDPARFVGRGSLRGHLSLPPGQSAPTSWKITVGPSRTLAGRDHAVERTLELPGSATEFEIKDLPLGGYDVRVRTEKFASLAQAVSLERGSEHPYVQVGLEPLGTVRGILIDTEDRLLADREVLLQLRRSGEVLTTRTRADGTWFMESVEPGAWTMYIDSIASPAIDPIDFDNSGARSSNLGEQRVPVTGILELRIVDELQVARPNMHVLGYSMNGGSFEAISDDAGMVTVNALALGEWKVMVVDEQEQRVRKTVTLSGGETLEVDVTFGR